MTPRAPVSGLAVKNAGARRVAAGAGAVFGEVPLRQLVPITPDEQLNASVAIGAARPLVVNIAYIGVAHPVLRCDLARLKKRVPGGGRWSRIFQSG